MAAAIGIGFAFAAVLSVRAPFPMSDTGAATPSVAEVRAKKPSAGFAALGAVFLASLIVSPLVLLSLHLPLTSPLQTAIALGGTAIGYVAWRFGLAAATSPRRPDGAALPRV